MSNFQEVTDEELKLVRQLKEAFCEKSGKETDSKRAAEIFHKLGKIYRKRNWDKMSLIMCVALFNNAMVRNPLNISQIKSDLSEICQYILQLANAKNQTADLVQKAKHVKAKLYELRNKVKATLQKSVPRIPAAASGDELEKLKKDKILAIQQLNKMIGEQYKLIMADLSQFCEEVMGNPPCQYVVVGLGSLAREEITPYSDFDCFVLFDDKNYQNSYLNYFRWYWVIFYVVIHNLQEAIIFPSCDILNGTDSDLKDWIYKSASPQYLLFKGMMRYASKFPIGRSSQRRSSELIKPLSEMLDYLGDETSFLNGYHITIILSNICFVFGNKDIFEQFENGVKIVRENALPLTEAGEVLDDEKQKIERDFTNYATRLVLTELKLDTIDVKRVYRITTIFIATLGKIHNITANASFDIIDELTKQNKITQNTASTLQYAVAIACEMRLRVLLENKSPLDIFYLKQTNGDVKTFLDIVGMASTISYFQIAYCLQCEVAKQQSFSKFLFTDPHQFNVLLSLAFEKPDLIRFSKSIKKQFFNITEFDFDEYIEQLESELMLNPSKFEISTNQFLKTFKDKFWILRSTFRKRNAKVPLFAILFTHSRSTPYGATNPKMLSNVLPSCFSAKPNRTLQPNRISAVTSTHHPLYRKMLLTILVIHFLKKFSKYILSTFIRNPQTSTLTIHLKDDQVTSVAKYLYVAEVM